MANEVHIAPYDPAWPVAFADEAARLQARSPGAFLRLEHIGSTAVPGLDAKPVIDLMALVSDLGAARTALVGPLAQDGYTFWSDNPAPDRLFFVRGLPPAPRRTHHLHLVFDPAVLARHIAFRDALRGDTALRHAYAALKRDLAGRHRTDREAYTKAKAAFIAEALGEGGV